MGDGAKHEPALRTGDLSHQAIADWCIRHPRTEHHLALYGTADPAGIAVWLSDACRALLDAPASGFLSYQWGQVATAGVELADGRRVALKVYPDGYEAPDVLGACRAAQDHWAGAGLPVPRPLAGPTRYRTAWLVADEYWPGGKGDPRSPGHRRAMAELLARLLATGPLPGELLELARSRLATHPLGTEVIDPPSEIVRAYRRASERLVELEAGEPALVTHLDWRMQNMGWQYQDITAVYDWDSVTIATEARALGVAAGMFSYDFSLDDRVVPSPEDVWAFISEYEQLRGVAGVFNGSAARSAALAKLAGYALVEHGLDPAGEKRGPWSFRTALTDRLSGYLELLS